MNTSNYQAMQVTFGTHSRTKFTATEAGAEKRLVPVYVSDDEADWTLYDAERAPNASRALTLLRKVAPRLGHLQAAGSVTLSRIHQAVETVAGRNGLPLGKEGLWTTMAEIGPLIRQSFDTSVAEIAAPHIEATRKEILDQVVGRNEKNGEVDREILKRNVVYYVENIVKRFPVPHGEVLDYFAEAAGLTDAEINGPNVSREKFIADFDLRLDSLMDLAEQRGEEATRDSLLARHFEQHWKDDSWRGVQIARIDRMLIGWRAVDPSANEWLGSPRLLVDPFHGAANDAPPIAATAFRLGDAAAIPRREWLYGTTLIRKFISVTVAPGGVGKSSLTIVEALAMVSGRPLLGEALPVGKLRVWLWNGEDPLDELSRRIHAACLRHDLDEEAIGGRLFVNSGRDMGLVVMREVRKEVVAVEPVVEAVVAEIEAKKIDVLIVDPFVTTHEVSENDNTAMNRVAGLWQSIANRTGCAIMLVHHAKKMQGAEVNAEDARGASALNSAARMVRTLNAMTKDEADRFGVNPDDRFSHVRIGDANGKANLTRRSGRDTWFRLANVGLGNGRGNMDPGDEVGVVEAWAPPSVEARSALSREEVEAVRVEIGRGEHRLDERADRWVGHTVGRALALDLDPSKPEDRKRARAHVKAVVKRLIDERHLAVVQRPDAARKMRDFVVIGPGASE